MLTKINSKPIIVQEDPETERKDWVLFCIKCLGYIFILWIMDYVCFTFFYIHPIPIISKLFTWIGGMI